MPLPIILAATAGLFIATVWSAVVGQNAVACVFGIFAGFAELRGPGAGPGARWFGITLLAIKSTQELFLTVWLVIIVMLTLATRGCRSRTPRCSG